MSGKLGLVVLVRRSGRWGVMSRGVVFPWWGTRKGAELMRQACAESPHT